MLEADVLEPFYLDREYKVGDRFVQPSTFSDSAFVDQWILGRLGDFDQTFLDPRIKEMIEEPDFIELRRSMLLCGDCR
jgi:hypothetical protein